MISNITAQVKSSDGLYEAKPEFQQRQTGCQAGLNLLEGISS
jgi:hypothetical protein